MVLETLAAAAAHFPTEYTGHVIVALIAALATYFVLRGSGTAQGADRGKGAQKKQGDAQLGAGTADTAQKGKMTSVGMGGAGHGGNEQKADEKEGAEDDDGEWGDEWWEGYIGGWGEGGQLLG
jgi:hypothetical protein